MNVLTLSGAVLFIIGFLLFLSSPARYMVWHGKPNPPILGPVTVLLGVVFVILGFYSFVQFVNNTFNQGLFIIYFGLTVISGVLAGACFKFAVGASKHRAENMRALADAKASEVLIEQRQIELEYARDNAERDQILREHTHRTAVREQQVKRTQLTVAEEEALLRSEMVPVARQAGLGGGRRL